MPVNDTDKQIVEGKVERIYLKSRYFEIRHSGGCLSKGQGSRMSLRMARQVSHDFGYSIRRHALSL